MKLKDMARAKAERRAARRAQPRSGEGGPPIATDETVGIATPTDDSAPGASATSANSATTPSPDRSR
jgi:hypothetical protein